MYIDYKTRIWQRIKIQNDDFPNTKVLELVEQYPESSYDLYDALEREGARPINEILYDTEEEISIEENQGNETMELFYDDGTNAWDNLRGRHIDNIESMEEIDHMSDAADDFNDEKRLREHDKSAEDV